MILSAVGAVYDPPRCCGFDIVGGHRPPLQWIILNSTTSGDVKLASGPPSGLLEVHRLAGLLPQAVGRYPTPIRFIEPRRRISPRRCEESSETCFPEARRQT